MTQHASTTTQLQKRGTYETQRNHTGGILNLSAADKYFQTIRRITAAFEREAIDFTEYCETLLLAQSAMKHGDYQDETVSCEVTWDQQVG